MDKQQTKLQQTEIGEIPEEWEIIKLMEIGDLKNGVNFSRNDFGNGLPIINVKNLFRGRFATINDLDQIKKESIKNYDKYLLRKDDLLFTRSSLKQSGAGQAALVNNLPAKETLYSGFIIRFRKKYNSHVNMQFLNYLVRSKIYRELIPRILSGTTITNINQQILSELPIILPSLKEQSAIAKILSDLDSKIELNQQINKNLETIGQSIFNHWLIDFEFPNEKGKPYKSNVGEMVYNKELEKDVPTNCEIKPLDKIADFLNGLPLQKYPAETEENSLPVIKIRELRQGITNSSDRCSNILPEEYIINDGDIIFSWSGSLDIVIWCNGKGGLNQHLFKVSSEKYPKWFYYFWVKNHLPNFQHIAEGKATTMGHIQRHHLTESLVISPPKEILGQMNKIMAPLFERIINVRVESKILAQIRDLLLPKLMSGKIRVPVEVEA
ncbi:restriction endonuclease subunit S [Candidatus Woesearchaeota archaeon]|nr:restriction endonuclease subunit S [Candidatus Woesearchaeota archaeon]